jgi:hypothetical protein
LDEQYTADFLERVRKASNWDGEATALEKIVCQLDKYSRVLARPGETRFFHRSEWSEWLSTLSKLNELTASSPALAPLRNEFIHQIEERLKYLVENVVARHNWEEGYALQEALVTLDPSDKGAAQYLEELKKASSMTRRESIHR